MGAVMKVHVSATPLAARNRPAGFSSSLYMTSIAAAPAAKLKTLAASAKPMPVNDMRPLTVIGNSGKKAHAQALFGSARSPDGNW
jgi:hypothetical protein